MFCLPSHCHNPAPAVVRPSHTTLCHSFSPSDFATPTLAPPPSPLVSAVCFLPDAQPDDNEATYAKVDAVGKQVVSTKQTLPSHKIGTSTRDSCKKVFISKEHEKSSYGAATPGPTTNNFVDSFGPQTMSQKKSLPSWGFGTSKRDPFPKNDTPGPGTYIA